jgi:hypothetical protein
MIPAPAASIFHHQTHLPNRGPRHAGGLGVGWSYIPDVPTVANSDVATGRDEGECISRVLINGFQVAIAVEHLDGTVLFGQDLQQFVTSEFHTETPLPSGWPRHFYFGRETSALFDPVG